MSFLDDLPGKDQAGGNSLLGVVGQLIEKAGGLQGLVGMLQQHGLGSAAQSWVSTGPNQPVSGSQLGVALNSGGMDSLLQEAAGKLDVDQNLLLGKLSQVLPIAVNHLTPDGTVPLAGQDVGFKVSMLEGLAGKLRG